MAILRMKEARKLSKKELSDKLEELQKEMMKLNGQVASGATPENPGRIKEIKRTIARIMLTRNEIKEVNKK